MIAGVGFLSNDGRASTIAPQDDVEEAKAIRAEVFRLAGRVQTGDVEALDDLLAILDDLADPDDFRPSPDEDESAPKARSYRFQAVVGATVTVANNAHLDPEIDAESHFEDLTAVSLAMGDARSFAESRLHYGLWHWKRGRLGEAKNIFVDALERSTAPTTSRVYMLVQLAELAKSRGDVSSAQSMAAEADSILDGAFRSRPAEGSRLRCKLDGLNARIATSLGLLDVAAERLKRMQENIRKVDDQSAPGLKAVWTTIAADMLLATGELRRLEAHVDAAETAAVASGQLDLARELRLRRAIGRTVAARIDPTDESIAAARDALAVLLEDDEVRGSLRLRAESWAFDVQLREDDLAGADATARSLRERVDEELARGDDPALLDQSLAAIATSRIALARGADRDVLESARERLDGVFEDYLDAWADVTPRPGGVGFLHFNQRRQLLIELMRVTMALQPGEAGRIAALELLVRARSMGGFVRTRGVPCPGFAEARERLTTETQGLLVFVPGPERTLVFAVDSKSVVLGTAAGTSRLRGPRRELVTRVTGAMPVEEKARTARGARIAAAAAELGGLLLPAEARAAIARWDHVAIVGVDLLDEVAFEVLPHPGGGTLGHGIALSYLPSLPVGAILAGRTRAKAPEIELVTVGAPTVPEAAAERWPNLVDIPFDDRDESTLVRSFESDRVRVLRGDAAGVDDVLALPHASARVLCFVTHGIHTGEVDGGTALVLADEDDGSGLLRRADVERLVDTAPLVVLAACGAGRAPLRRGDGGRGGLAGAFLGAGSVTVIESTNPLEYHTTRDLLAVFFERLRASGDSPAEALRRARVALVKSGKSDARIPLMRVVGLGNAVVFD